jgi:hypothetical protein
MKSKIDFRDNWPAPNEYLLELGRMTSIWGTLESLINLSINKFAGYQATLDPRALILLAHSNFQQRVHMVGALCEWLVSDYPHLKDYKIVISKLEAAQKLRNKFAHNSITWDDDTQTVTISWATARGSLKTKTEIVNLQDIVDATAKIHEAMCALQTLVMGKELKPLWERDT